MSAEIWYVDSSALVKTVVEEPESRRLMSWLAAKHRLVACELVRVETVRAVRVSDSGAVARARRVVSTLTLIRLDDVLYRSPQTWSLRCCARAMPSISRQR